VLHPLQFYRKGWGIEQSETASSLGHAPVNRFPPSIFRAMTKAQVHDIGSPNNGRINYANDDKHHDG
jgi:hypothetical protein